MTDAISRGVEAVTRLAIWWHRKLSGHHTMTFYRTPPIIVQCKDCPREWRL